MGNEQRDNERPRCEHCGAAVTSKLSVTDTTRRNRRVRIYECPSCGKLLWKESA
jgi:uncharacterized protein with PIN domain